MTLPRTGFVCLATCLLLACTADELPTGSPASASLVSTPPSRPFPLSPFLLARLPTYDHSMQAVHPDVIHFDKEWNGWEYWMAFTPFPGGQTSFENPSIAVSHNGVNWHVPDGVTNPLIKTPANGYNSDPDLSFDVIRGELVMIYRTVSAGYNHVSEIRSSDGVHWGRSLPLFRRKNHEMVSPTIAMTPTGGARLWYVDAGSSSCAKRVTRVMTQVAESPATLRNPGLERGWSTARRTGLVQPGYTVWHLDVSWIAERNEYWAVYSAYPGTACNTQELFFARSADGIAWQSYAIPFIQHGQLPWTSGSMYRATVMYDAAAGLIRFYTSSMAPVQTWRIGLVEYKLSTFLTALTFGVAAPPARVGSGAGQDIEP